MTSLLQSCQAQYEALAKERIEHQKQLKWEREKHKERDRIAKEERESERKRLDKLDEIAKEEREQNKKKEKKTSGTYERKS